MHYESQNGGQSECSGSHPASSRSGWWATSGCTFSALPFTSSLKSFQTLSQECRGPTVNELMWQQGRNQQWVCKDNINLSATATLAENTQIFKKGIYVVFSSLRIPTLYSFFSISFPCFFSYSSFFTIWLPQLDSLEINFTLYNSIKGSNFFSSPPFSPPPPQNLL